jgi:zinc protease
MSVQEDFTLANGLRVITAHMPGANSTTLWAGYACGSRHDPFGESGLAHLIEHLSYVGIADEYCRCGAVFNGRTFLDFTGFTASFLPQHLPRFLGVERRRMSRFTPTSSDISRERLVILAEMDRLERRPEWVLANRVAEECFAAHPYRNPTVGKRHELESISVKDVERHAQVRYSPERAVLVITGKIGLDRARDAVERAFGDLEGRPPEEPEPTVCPAGGRGGVTLEEISAGPSTGFHYCYRGPSSSSDDFGLLVLTTLLLAGSSPWTRQNWGGLLKQQARVMGQVRSLEMSVRPTRDPGAVHVLGWLHRQRDRSEVERWLDAIPRTVASASNHRSLRKAVRQLHAGFLDCRETPGRLANRIGEAVFTGCLVDDAELGRRVASASTQQMCDLSTHYFSEENRIAGWVTVTNGCTPKPC